MFTGIIEEIGSVQGVQPGKLTVRAKKVLEGTRIGDSIAVNGACLTVVKMTSDSFTVDVAPETLRRSNLGLQRPGDAVNLERAMALGERMGGHMVQGHIEGTGKVVLMSPEGEAIITRFSSPPELMPYIVQKGFIAVDGISLTVVDLGPDWFTVSLIGFTRENTNLSRRKAGDVVNLETDIIARYVERFLEARRGGVTMGLLREQGFV